MTTPENKSYSLRKARDILKTGFKWYKKKKEVISPQMLQEFETDLKELDEAVLSRDQEKMNIWAPRLESFYKSHFKKSVFEHFFETFLAILVALVVATIIRQMWFELYEIPTGSMRPTLKEQDHLSVTKTAFGLNIPLEAAHFYFDPSLVQREGIIIWTGENMPHLDAESKFMGIFPYAKRFVKRCMGKPGDILYFYGGRIYGLDREGNPLTHLNNNPWTEKLEYIPFSRFEGRVEVQEKKLTGTQEALFYHFNQLVGRFNLSQEGSGEILSSDGWVKDNPEAQKKEHPSVQTLSDFWGMKNFAMVQLLSKEQLEKTTPFQVDAMEPAELYLEIRHTPSLNFPPLLAYGNYRLALTGYSTVLPLQEKHLKNLMSHLYTCRFVVKDERASPYRVEGVKFTKMSPAFPGVPDGTYEFYYGKAWKISWGGIATELPLDHPLYRSSPQDVQRLFNLGIDMNTVVEKTGMHQFIFPNRYAYFREGNLLVMGGVLMEKEDPLLKSFHAREVKRASLATKKNPYVPFQDYGAPVNEKGDYDHALIKTFGYKVPEGHYLALGDNHAMSQDSRYFGPIPQSNLQGAPSLILWPPGERWGIPNQKPYPFLTLPRLVVWSIAGVVLLGWLLWLRRRNQRSIFD